MTQGNGAFKSMPTFETLAKRLSELEVAHVAQGELINYLLEEIQEREFEVCFLMNISQVVIPTSKIADANGKIPAIRKLAKQVYDEGGRDQIVAAFDARQKALRDAEDLPQADSGGAAAHEESPQAPEAIDSTVPNGKTH